MNDERRDPSDLLVACLGDVAPAEKVQEYIRHAGVETAARRLWAPVAGSGLLLANLETPLQSDSETAGLFNRTTCLGLANNHIMDAGESGLAETMELLAGHEIPHAGAGPNLNAARQPAMIATGGLRLGVLCAADPRFNPAGPTTPGVFPARPGLLRESIADTARSCDRVIVSLHMGIEFLPYPSAPQVRLAEACLDAGAALVVFHHAHCIGGHRLDGRGAVLFGTGKYLFPYDDYVGRHGLTRRAIRRARRAAAWRIRLGGPDTRLQDILPLWIGDDGFPEIPARQDAERTLAQIRRLSHRSASALPFWRTLALLDPVFAGLNARAYLELARQTGFRRMLATAGGGVRTQLFPHRETDLS